MTFSGTNNQLRGFSEFIGVSKMTNWGFTLKDKPATRRGILSTVSSIYDPLGMASPFLLTGKRILQRLCHEKLDWDEPIPSNYLVEWERWRASLPLLENI